ncbi:hypothetical protein GYB22_00135 [bacterium]|nr:hypothetical protein [bacterium]
MKRKIIAIIFLILGFNLSAQIDSSLLNPQYGSDPDKMNMDAVYQRPFLAGNSIAAIGGYVEADYQYMGTDGITDGHQFSIPRLTLFIASSAHRKLRFLSELEIENGGEELTIEFAAVDLLLHPLLNLRSGVIMNPIGAFNQNHDGPKWEFIKRPIAMTQLLPATWSNPGVGSYGKWTKSNFSFGYEYYLSHGFNSTIIDNSEARTFLPAAKADKTRFTETLNGKVMQTAKLAGRYKNFELGLSYMGGVYNNPVVDELSLENERKQHCYDIDFSFQTTDLQVVGEWVYIQVDVPETYNRQYGNSQTGGFLDIIYPFYKRPVFGFNDAVFNAALRFEYVDWNLQNFEETNEPIGDELTALVLGISFRPVQTAVFRINYRFQQEVDLFGNPPANTRGIEIGVASYF